MEVEAPVAPAAPAASPSAPAAPAVETPAAPAPAPQGADAPAPADEKPAQPDPKAERAKYERRAQNAYRKAAEAQARAEHAEKRAAELEQRYAPKPATAEGAPKIEDFTDINEYAKAVEKFGREQGEKDVQTKQRTEAQKREQARLVESWESKSERGAEKYDDFEAVVGDIKPTTPWAAAMMEADNADDIAYHLGSNIEEAKRIASLPPVSQIREIGRLEAKLAATPPQPKKPSQAPAPIAPLTGTTPASSEPRTDREWFERRLKRASASR